jgi:NNP family nitrate/nitrite transporter-like MFS transporter
MVLIFGQTKSPTGAICVMIICSLFVQAAEGSAYGIVPYVDPASTGSIAGIVGADGNTVAVGFGLGFRQLDYKEAFMIMGFTILASEILSVSINNQRHAGLLCGKDTVTEINKGALVFPEQEESAEDVEDNEA